MTDGAAAAKVVIQISDELDVYVSRSRVRSLALSLGFPPRAVGELVIVASELAWNILRHAGRGELEVVNVEDPEMGSGVCILARDNGSPFHDFETALIDGHNDRGPIDPVELLGRGGIGGGLGAVTRFSDRVSYTSDESGKCISAFRACRKR